MSRFSRKKTPNLLKPKPLRPGAGIGIATPSFPGHVALKHKFEKAVVFLEAQGFNVKLGALTENFVSQGYRAGTAVERAKEFEELYQDPDISAIIFSIGGANSASILPYLDYDYIRKFPKILSGYSDITSIHAALNKECGLCTFYGPAIIPSFGNHPHPDKFTYDNFLIQTGFKGKFDTYTFPSPGKFTDHFIDARDKNWTSVKRVFKKNAGWKILRKGNASGKSYSYNLNTLVSLAGTNYFPALENAILCIEQMHTGMANEERQLTQLKLMGVFDIIKGLIISKPEQFDTNDASISYPELVNEIIPSKAKFPVVLNFDCGHTHPMLTVAQGVACTLQARDHIHLIQQECGFA